MKLTKELLDSVRHIEGFPIGKDEDIINLSDAPYYTACPNPFINEFIEKYGTPYDETNDDYDVEPYTADVSEGKSDPIYNAHTYHTKVPHKAIMRYILHYTKPGDIIFDGFCGTGMAGVAAQICGTPPKNFVLKVEKESKDKVEWGERKAVLCDLAPVATFIAYNYNKYIDVSKFEKKAQQILANVEKECGWMYETIHLIDGKYQKDITGEIIKGKINYIVWSDVFVCPNCGQKIIFWESGVTENGKVKKEIECDKCGVKLKKKDMEKLYETIFDKATNEVVKLVKQVPVKINYKVGNKNYNKSLDENDFRLINKIEESEMPYWYPINEIPEGYNTNQPKRSHGLKYIHQFYSKRNLWVLSSLYNKIIKENDDIKRILLLLFTSQLINVSKLNRHRENVSFPYNPLSGTLYISSMISEANVIKAYSNKIKKIVAAKNLFVNSDGFCITCQSSTLLTNIPNNSFDYIFTDPPFGDNLMYSELNFIWESWIKIRTNNESEAIMNKIQQKELYQYQQLMERSFAENYRILKPGRWMTVEFHNSKNSVWNAIQEAILKAGFIIANVKTLDKKQGSFKQVTTHTAVKQDLIISAYKPKEAFVQRFLEEAGTEEGVWDFIREHLKKLPVTSESNDMLDIIAEREDYLLFDSMVAYHIQKGASIPMGASEFYAGLKQRFSERDGMYFLPEQVSIYDAKRMKKNLNEQLSFLILDEKSAIQWLRKELDKENQTYQQIQPKFIKELHQLKHERLPELKVLLEENFLQDKEGKWYVPDFNKQSDLEKLREKSLIKEFEEYKNSKGKLKVFRTEAIKVGFKACWKEKDYKTIVSIGERMPDKVIQEDQALLMYYDNAQTRIGD